MEIPVYLITTASHYLGKVDVESKDDFLEAAEKLWEEKSYDTPQLCHHCADDMELGEWEIDNNPMYSLPKETP